MAEKEKIKMLAQNRSAHHDFFIDEKTEAGIELFGTEVKSIRMGIYSTAILCARRSCSFTKRR